MRPSHADIREYSRAQNVSLDEALNKLVLAGVCAKGLEGKTVCLDWEPGEALALAKQYRAESGHELEHIVNAAVEYALNMVFNNRCDAETWNDFAGRVAKVATRIIPSVGEPRESVSPAQVSAARYAASLGAILAFVRAKIDEIDPDGDNLEKQDVAASYRYLHVLLHQAMERFGLLFELDASESMNPPEPAARAEKPAAAAATDNPAAETVRAVVVELDERALELADSYSEHKIGDIINGALHFCLESETIILQGATLEEAIDATAGRRLGLDNWTPNAKPKRASRGRRGAKANPADLALLASAAPEAVEPAPPAGDDEHLPEEEHIDEPGDGTAAQDGKEAQ